MLLSVLISAGGGDGEGGGVSRFFQRSKTTLRLIQSEPELLSLLLLGVGVGVVMVLVMVL